MRETRAEVYGKRDGPRQNVQEYSIPSALQRRADLPRRLFAFRKMLLFTVHDGKKANLRFSQDSDPKQRKNNTGGTRTASVKIFSTMVNRQPHFLPNPAPARVVDQKLKILTIEPAGEKNFLARK